MRSWGVLVVAAVLVLAGVSMAFMLVGTPAHQRQLAFDRRRIELLGTMRDDIVAHYDAPLPAHLPARMIEHDPQTHAPFAYHALNRNTYKLCATFAFPGDDRPGFDQWKHGAGFQCFRFSV